MPLPADFQFSQSSLQDLADCQRRFQLRYILRLPWPAIEAEPLLENERHMQQGALFHRMAHQHQLGIPADRLLSMAQDFPLRDWWQNYVDQAVPWIGLQSPNTTTQHYPEFTLGTRVGGYRLLAKYDLLLLAATGEATIVDWKTTRTRPRRRSLEQRWQSRVYPFVLARAGGTLSSGQPMSPAAIKMVYWFANAPDEPETFGYSAEQLLRDEQDLLALIRQAENLPAEGDLRTAQVERCRFCVYRSLCDRGTEAGLETERPDNAADGDALEFSLDFDQIAEIRL